MNYFQFSLQLPQSWTKQIDEYKLLVHEVNDLLGKKGSTEVESKSHAVIGLFELIYATLEYLEFDALELAKTEKIINNPRIKSYETQLQSLLVTLEEICQSYPELAIDRYALALEVFRKLIYIDLDGITFFIKFIYSINVKIKSKKVTKLYLKDYLIFCIEIAIISFESKKYTSSIEIFQELTKLVYEPIPDFPFDYSLIPFLGLAICYEVIGNYNEASNIYFELLNRLRLEKVKLKDELPLQFIHEVSFFGYVNSFLSEKKERLNPFYSLVELCDSNVGDLVNGLHSMAIFGYPMLEAFHHLSIDSINKSITYYLGTSIVQSNQKNNSMGLTHLEPDLFLTNIETKIRNQGAQKAILIVQTQHLKDIQVTIGKNNLPSLNVLPDIDDTNYVTVDGIKFNINSQFAFGTSFSNEIELSVHYQKKLIFKRKINLTDKFPPFFLIDIDKEMTEVIAVKDGSIKQFDVLWVKDMNLIDTIKAIALIDLAHLTFSNDSESKNFFKDFINLLKKLNLKEPEKVITDLSKQGATNMITGKALKLVLIQRLSEIEPNNPEIYSVIEQIANQ
jgi:tetratricopeptide (TPR) repeat protein